MESGRAHAKPTSVAGTATAITIPREELLEVARELHDDEALRYEHLSFITAVDYDAHFELVYRFYSYTQKCALTLKTQVVDVSLDDARVLYGPALPGGRQHLPRPAYARYPRDGRTV